jgi:hypothetical protein
MCERDGQAAGLPARDGQGTSQHSRVAARNLVLNVANSGREDSAVKILFYSGLGKVLQRNISQPVVWILIYVLSVFLGSAVLSKRTVDLVSPELEIRIVRRLWVGGTWLRNWLRHYATSWNVAGSIPDEVTGFLTDIILPAALRPCGRLNR